MAALVCPPIWHSVSRTPVCRYGHPQVDLRDTAMVLEYRVDGIVLQTCRTCDPCTYALGVISRSHRLITYYDLSYDQLGLMLRLPDDTEVIEMLSMLGYSSRRGV